jgi:predicted transcriptional regulator
MADSTQTAEAKTPQWDEDLVCCAIANPIRRQILSLLAEGKPLSMDEMRKHIKGTADGTRKHLEYLRQAGVITLAARSQSDARRREYVLSPSIPVTKTSTGKALDLTFGILNV